jgi:hypothetical protein
MRGTSFDGLSNRHGCVWSCRQLHGHRFGHTRATLLSDLGESMKTRSWATRLEHNGRNLRTLKGVHLSKEAKI